MPDHQAPKRWPDHVDLYEFLGLSRMLDRQDLAKRYGVTTRTISAWLSYLNEQGMRPETGGFPEPIPLSIDEHVQITRDRVVIIGDSEIPYHDPSMFALATACAQAYEIDTLIINGDFIAHDCFSPWKNAIVHQLAFREELDPAVKSIQRFLAQFKEIYLNNGNHERRLAHLTDGHITIGQFFERFAGVNFSEHAHLHLKSGDEDIWVCHQDNYSKVPLSVPRQLVTIKHMNIVCGHTHHMCWGWDPSGRFWIAEGGHCRAHAQYKALRTNTHPEWNPGFLMIFDGQPQFVTRKNAEFWLQTVGLKRERRAV